MWKMHKHATLLYFIEMSYYPKSIQRAWQFGDRELTSRFPTLLAIELQKCKWHFLQQKVPILAVEQHAVRKWCHGPRQKKVTSKITTIKPWYTSPLGMDLFVKLIHCLRWYKKNTQKRKKHQKTRFISKHLITIPHCSWESSPYPGTLSIRTVHCYTSAVVPARALQSQSLFSQMPPDRLARWRSERPSLALCAAVRAWLPAGSARWIVTATAVLFGYLDGW